MPEPRAERPSFPQGYGVHESADGLLDWSWAEERLRAARNYWVCTTRDDGRPAAAPVWGVWLDGAVLFGTNPESVKGRNLARDPRIVVHLESGDEVVILEGVVEPAGEERRRTLADEYERKYGYRPGDDQVAGFHQLRPQRALAWLETDYPRTATRFVF